MEKKPGLRAGGSGRGRKSGCLRRPNPECTGASRGEGGRRKRGAAGLEQVVEARWRGARWRERRSATGTKVDGWQPHVGPGCSGTQRGSSGHGGRGLWVHRRAHLHSRLRGRRP